MSDAFSAMHDGGSVIDYAAFRVGDPAGDRHIIECTRCKRPGLAHGRKCLHLVRYYQTPSGKQKSEIAKACSGGAPKQEPPPKRQTGFFFCPKDLL